jgi:hypothetical protein
MNGRTKQANDIAEGCCVDDHELQWMSVVQACSAFLKPCWTLMLHDARQFSSLLL